MIPFHRCTVPNSARGYAGKSEIVKALLPVKRGRTTPIFADDFWMVSEAAALRVSARVGAPGGRALPLGLNYVCIHVIRAIRGRILFWH
jgi:hypothetical protein